MATRKSNPSLEALQGSFGFDPDQAVAHFIVHVPRGGTQPVDISEHLSWDPDRVALSAHFGSDREDGQVRCRLVRPKWNEIADVVRAEFNARLKREGKRSGRWKTGFNPVARLLGKELVLLVWAIEDADPALIPTAIANWQGLTPEERWWLYTMTAAATGNVTTGRGRGWRKAVRYALTENPVTHRGSDQPIVPEFFRLISETPAISGNHAPAGLGPESENDTNDARPEASTIVRETDPTELLEPARTTKKQTRRKKAT